MPRYAKPDFIIVGAAKSGTTSLFHYLNRHPDIFIPAVKECRFFSQLPKNFKGLGAEFFPNSGITDEKTYFALFAEAGDKVCGDISNDYLYYYNDSVENIKKYLGDDVRIIIILRNPIDRAYSNYLHHVRDGWEDLSFEEAIAEEQNRIAQNWAWGYHYVKAGFYSEPVRTYLENFSHVEILLYEDLKDPDTLLKKIYRFIGVGCRELNGEGERQYNVSGYPKNRLLHRLLTDGRTKRLAKFLLPVFLKRRIVAGIKNRNLKKIPMNAATRAMLLKTYEADIKRLSALIGRDLSQWLR